MYPVFLGATSLLLPVLLPMCQAKKKGKDNSPVLKNKDNSTKKLTEKSVKKTSTSSTEDHPITMGATQRSEGLRTAHVEDSFDCLKPRQMFVNRYDEIVDAQKASRQNPDYDTMKLVEEDNFSKDVAVID